MTKKTQETHEEPGIFVTQKDRLFCMIFKEKKELLGLYNAMNQTSYSNEDDLTIRSKLLDERIGESGTTYSTKDIGDIGEYLVHGHECMRLKLMGAEKYIHLVKKIPTQLAVGYDISSVEVDGKKRYIEVKTTISNKPMHFNRVHIRYPNR